MKKRIPLRNPWLRLSVFYGLGLAICGSALAQEEEADGKAEAPQAFNIVVEAVAAEDIEEYEPPTLWIGVLLKNVEGDLAKYLGTEKGILVESVYEGSPADKAKLQAGDVLLRANDTELANPKDLLTVMQSIEDGDTVQVGVLRRGEKLTLELMPTKRPADLAEKMEKDLENIEKSLNLELSAVADLEDKSLADVLKKAYAENGKQRVQIFRMGDGPAYLFKNEDGESKDIEVTVMKNVEGNEIKVSVVRKDDQPAEITVDRGGEVKKFSEKDLDKLPEEVAEIVKATLDGNRFQFKILSSAEAIELRPRQAIEKARELAEKQAALAQEHAAKIRVQVEKGVAEAQEMAELREQVEQLRNEVKELRKRIKEDD